MLAATADPIVKSDRRLITFVRLRCIEGYSFDALIDEIP